MIARAVRAARRLHVALDGLRARRRCATTRRTSARCSSSSGSTAARSSPPTSRCSRARSRRQDGTYTRRYPPRGLFAHPVGYSLSSTPGRAGLERFYNDELTGPRPGELQNTLSTACRASAAQGDDLRTTLDPAAQQVALDAARRAHGRGRRARPAHRAREGDGVASPATTRTRCAAPAQTTRAQHAHPDSPLLQPRHAGRLPAGLDVQGRDGDRRDRQRQVTRPTSRVDGAQRRWRSPACR